MERKRYHVDLYQAVVEGSGAPLVLFPELTLAIGLMGRHFCVMHLNFHIILGPALSPVNSGYPGMKTRLGASVSAARLPPAGSVRPRAQAVVAVAAARGAGVRDRSQAPAAPARDAARSRAPIGQLGGAARRANVVEAEQYAVLAIEFAAARSGDQVRFTGSSTSCRCAPHASSSRPARWA